MYFKRLRIKDFGPIRDIEFNFEKDKVYHFVGENDTGKSMVLDAMNILCNNIAGIHVKKYVSDYAENFFIEAEDFEGNIIQLQRGEVSYYNLILPDGTEKYYDKIGSGVPVTIQKIVNVYEDELKKEKFNFRYSDDKILFMNTTPGENYSFFQKALRTDKVLNALKKANTLQNSYEKDIDITRSKIEFEKEKLENNPDITYIRDELEVYRKSIKNTMGKAKKLHELKETNKRLEDLESISIPKELMEFNSIEERKKLSVVVKSKELIRLLENNRNMLNVTDKYREIEDIHSEITDQKQILEVIGEILKGVSKDQLIEKLIEIGEKVSEIEIGFNGGVNELKLIDEKGERIRNLELLEKRSNIIEEMCDRVGNISKEFTEEYIGNKNNKASIKELQDGLEDLRNMTEGVELNRKEVEELDAERTLFMKENNFCPVVANSVTKKCPFSNKTLEELMGVN